MKEIILFIVILISLLVNTSCQKEINPNDIYGYWSLQNDVHFTKEALTHLVFREGADSWGDPVISDTIYHYTNINVIGDKLLLESENGEVRSCVLKELHDSILVISDFPGVSNNNCLYLKKVMAVTKKFHPHFKSFDISLLPKDSMDINMKSPVYYKENEEAFILSQDKVLIARNILEDFMSKIRTSDAKDEVPFEFAKYLRYYAGTVNESGEECAFICLDRYGYYTGCFPYSYFKQYIPSVRDGGKYQIYAIVNLIKRKVVDFYFNDISGTYQFADSAK